MQTSSYGFSCRFINTNKYFIKQISNLSEIILNFFQTPLGFVCWWCKIYTKMSDTMVVYRNQLTKRFMVGRSNKNRKERIKQLLRKDNLTTPHNCRYHRKGITCAWLIYAILKRWCWSTNQFWNVSPRRVLK